MTPIGQGQPVCCGPPAGPESSPYERPGYRLWHFVEDFLQTSDGAVPRLKTRRQMQDFFGTLKVRCGIGRNAYRISPGLYCTGNPTDQSPVMVTANYKLSFDQLRLNLAGRDAWILVLDTRGINVWCAAGKGTFSTDEVVRRVKAAGLEKRVRHRKLILPQLSATGVSAHSVKKQCGFEVLWGPIKAENLKAFIDSDMKAADGMRRVTFSFFERLVLIPVELSQLPKHLVWILLAAFLLSGIGPDIFSFQAAWTRGTMLAAACGLGILAGAVMVPALLPWIPGRAFSLKGTFTGIIAGLWVPLIFYPSVNIWETPALLVFTLVVSSYLAMNFTGATPFTSPSGVEKEMRRAIPVQALGVVLVVVLWITAAFV